MSTRKAEHVPPYRLHKGSGQGYVQLDGARHYLGRHDLPETRQRYNQLIVEWLSNGRRVPVPADDITIVEVLERFITHAKSYYVKPDGTPTGELRAIVPALRDKAPPPRQTSARSFRVHVVRTAITRSADRRGVSGRDRVKRLEKRAFARACPQRIGPIARVSDADAVGCRCRAVRAWYDKGYPRTDA